MVGWLVGWLVGWDELFIFHFSAVCSTKNRILRVFIQKNKAFTVDFQKSTVNAQFFSKEKRRFGRFWDLVFGGVGGC